MIRGDANDKTLYPALTLQEGPKDELRAWRKGGRMLRKTLPLWPPPIKSPAAGPGLFDKTKLTASIIDTIPCCPSGASIDVERPTQHIRNLLQRHAGVIDQAIAVAVSQ